MKFGSLSLQMDNIYLWGKKKHSAKLSSFIIKQFLDNIFWHLLYSSDSIIWLAKSWREKWLNY